MRHVSTEGRSPRAIQEAYDSQHEQERRVDAESRGGKERQFKTKTEAVQFGAREGRASGHAQLVIKGRTVRIQSERTYGADPPLKGAHGHATGALSGAAISGSPSVRGSMAGLICPTTRPTVFA